MSFPLLGNESGRDERRELTRDRTGPRFETTDELIEGQPAIGVRIELAQESGACPAEENFIEHGAPYLGSIAPNIGAILPPSSEHSLNGIDRTQNGSSQHTDQPNL